MNQIVFRIFILLALICFIETTNIQASYYNTSHFSFSFTSNSQKLKQTLNETIFDLEEANNEWTISKIIEFSSNLMNGNVSSCIMAHEGLDLFSALQKYDGETYVVIIPGNAVETIDKPFISLGYSEGIQRLQPYIGSIQKLGKLFEKIVPNKLHSYVLEVLPIKTKTILFVYDLSAGILYLNEASIAPLDQVGDIVQLNKLYESFTTHFQAYYSTVTNESLKDPFFFLNSFRIDFIHLIAEGFWFCIACIFVLSIAIPLAANFLIADVVLAICEYFGGSSYECAGYAVDVCLLAFGLLPLYAYIIFIVCQVQTNCTSATILNVSKSIFGY